MNVTETPCAEFLENFIKTVMVLQPERIGVCAMLPDGSVMTGYYGECSHQDKAMMGYHFGLDAFTDTVKANAKEIVAAADEETDENN